MLTVVHDAEEANGSDTDRRSLLDEIVRDGARQMLAAALKAEVAAYVEQFADHLDEAMRQAPPPKILPKGFARFQSFSERAPVTGTWGDPRSATAEKGRRFLEIHAEALAAAIRDPALWTKPDDVWAPGRGQGTTAGSAT